MAQTWTHLNTAITNIAINVMTIAIITLAASVSILGAVVGLPEAWQTGGPLWILAGLALMPCLLFAMRKFRAAFIPGLIFVGYLKNDQAKGLSISDPSIIALLLLYGTIFLDLLITMTGKGRSWGRELFVQWKGIAAFGLLAAVITISYLYSPAPVYGLDKLTRFLVISGVLFVAPLILIRKDDDLRHFTLAMVVFATLLSIRLLFGVTDSSVFNPHGGAVLSDSRDVTQIGAGQVVGVGLLWLLFCPYCNLRSFFLVASVPLLCAALIASVARGPVLSFAAILIPFMLLRRVRAAVTSTKVWLPVLILGLLAFAVCVYWLQQQGAASEKFATKRAEIEEVLGGSSTPTYTAGKRLTLYRWALGMFSAKPVTGWGIGGWSYYAFDRDMPAYPHNLILEVAAEEGVIGLAALATLLLTVLLTMRRIWRASRDLTFIAPVFAFSLLVTMTSGDINVNRPLWLWCGMVFALAGIMEQRRRRNKAMDWKTYPSDSFMDPPTFKIVPSSFGSLEASLRKQS